jgi:nucleoside 2-deoxyribosyltransferase
MLIEVGYALASQKRIILAIKNDVKTTFLHQIANEVIEFENLEDLYKKIMEVR